MTATLPLARRSPCRTRSGITRRPGRALYSGSEAVPDRPAQEIARAVGEAIRPRRGCAGSRHPSIAASRAACCSPSRWEPQSSAASCSGVLAYLIRSLSHRSSTSTTSSPPGDSTTAAPVSTERSHVVTDLGNIRLVVALALVLLAVDFFRTRGRWCAPVPARRADRRGGRRSPSRISSAASGRR